MMIDAAGPGKSAAPSPVGPEAKAKGERGRIPVRPATSYDDRGPRPAQIRNATNADRKRMSRVSFFPANAGNVKAAPRSR